MKIQASLLAGLIAAAPGAALMAQDTVEVATDPVGYVSVDMTGASDTRIAVPMHRAPSFQGIPESVDGNSINFPEGAGITPEASAYFIAVRSGDLAGLRATVLDVTNDGDTLVVDDAVDLSGLAVGEGGDSVQLIAHWTLGSLFPEFPDETELFVYDRGDAAGVDLAPSDIFTHFEGAWFDENFNPADDRVVLLGESMIVRDSVGDDFTAVIAGSVPMFPVRDSLATIAADTQQDIALGFAVPAPIRVGDIEGAQDNDELFIPDNVQTGIDKAPAEILTSFGGEWFDENFAPADDHELVPGEGYIFRKAATDSPQSDVIVYTPSYLNE